ncbi:MAG TPA: 5-formyltetrahydrofolate cyclo-ligase [Casimicrobiaceae bacterium]
MTASYSPPPLAPHEQADADAIRRWRKAVREALVHARLAIDDAEHSRWSAVIHGNLASAFREVTGIAVSLYWPYRHEFDPRPLAEALWARGAVCALPVVAVPKAPLAFREWRADSRLEAGAYGIPVPVATAEVSPVVVLAPLAGFDALGYRLGYGTGYFDRTLAALGNRPVSVGVGFEVARLDSIHPQAHDVPLDFIVTERGLRRTHAGGRLANGGVKDFRHFDVVADAGT